MRPYLRLFLGLLLGVATLVACTPEQKERTPEQKPTDVALTLSATELTFSRTVETQSVTVTTGASQKWLYTLTPQVEWLTITQASGKLTIATAENQSGTARKATIAVVAGSQVAHIAITQQASDATLDLSSESISLPTVGGEKYLEVSSNLEGWTLVEPTAEWLQARLIADAHAIKLSAQLNESTEARQAELTLKLPNGTAKKVTIQQAGQLTYFTPYQANRKYLAPQDVIKSEEARGFKTVKIQRTAEGDAVDTPDALFFITSSKVLPQVLYYRDFDSNRLYDDAYVTLSDKEEMMPEGGYYKYLISQGYKPMYNSKPEEPRLKSPDGFFVARLYFHENSQSYSVIFQAQFVPDKAYPTFDKLPMYPEVLQQMIEDPTKKYADVQAWEQSLGSQSILKYTAGQAGAKVNPEEIYMEIYRTTPEGTAVEQQEFRYYNFHLTALKPAPEKVQSIQQVSLCYNDFTKIAFVTSKNQFRTTPEFEALAEKEGFIFHGFHSDGVRFVNEEKGLKMVVLMFMTPKEKSPFGHANTATIKYEKLPPKTSAAPASSSATQATEGTPEEAEAATAQVLSTFYPQINK